MPTFRGQGQPEASLSTGFFLQGLVPPSNHTLTPHSHMQWGDGHRISAYCAELRWVREASGLSQHLVSPPKGLLTWLV